MNMHSTTSMRVRALVAAGLLLGTAQPVFAACAADNENTAVPATAPTASFTDNGNGTVTDETTGLMWKRCSEGQAWSGTSCTGTPSSHAWQQALAQAEATSFAGFSDWRLPNKNELRSIVEQRCFNPSISVDIFPGTPIDWFWSSSPDAYYSDYAWYVDFGYGDAHNDYKGNDYRVRLVRAGQ